MNDEKIIKVRKATWKKLMRLRIDLELNSMDKTIEYLLQISNENRDGSYDIVKMQR